MPCIYVLYSKTTNRFYTGSSRDGSADSRIIAHNSGTTKSTKTGRPWIIILQEYYNTYTEARKREIFLKFGVGRKWLNNILKTTNGEVAEWLKAAHC